MSSQLTVERMRLGTLETAEELDTNTDPSSVNAFARTRQRISTSEQRVLLRAAEMLQSAVLSEYKVATGNVDETEDDAIMMQKWVEESHRERKEAVRAAARLRKMQESETGTATIESIAGQPKAVVPQVRAATELGRLRHLSKVRKTRSQRSLLGSRNGSPRDLSAANISSSGWGGAVSDPFGPTTVEMTDPFDVSANNITVVVTEETTESAPFSDVASTISSIIGEPDVKEAGDCMYGLGLIVRPRVIRTPCVGSDELYVTLKDLPKGTYTLRPLVKELMRPSNAEAANFFISVRCVQKATLEIASFSGGAATIV